MKNSKKRVVENKFYARNKERSKKKRLTVAETRSNRLWDRMTFEINLLTTRMNWLVSSQSFLFAAFFIGLDRAKDGVSASEVLVFWIPFIGICICIIVLIYIRTTNTILTECRLQLQKTRNLFPSELIDQVDVQHKTVFWRSKAQVASTLLVMLFLAFWLVAFLFLLLVSTPKLLSELEWFTWPQVNAGNLETMPPPPTSYPSKPWPGLC